MYKVYLGLGTNLGNRKHNIREAIDKIGEQIGVVKRQSALYETEPWGYSSPNYYINACVLVLTEMAPRQVLEATQKIEREMGRTMKSVDGEYFDRIIDIDILLIDDLKIDEPDFKIPHPLMEERVPCLPYRSSRPSCRFPSAVCPMSCPIPLHAIVI